MNKVTIATIAKLVGTSANTVSLALRDSKRISSAKREYIQGVAKKLGYESNPYHSEVMRRIRRGTRAGENIALFNLHPSPHSLKTDPSMSRLIEGVRSRAKATDHSLTELWLGDRSTSPARVQRILDTRSIRAGIIIGASMQRPTFHHYRKLWQNNVCANLAIRTLDPELPFSCVDHYMLILDAIMELSRRGYTRPALLITKQIEQWVDFRFHAAMQVGQELIMRTSTIPEFTECNEPPGSGMPCTFGAWFDRYQPDSILTFFPEVRDWILAMNRRVPEDVGIVLMDRLPRGHDFAHMDQHMATVGMNGVDLLTSLLLARNSEHPYKLIHNRASWVDGPTVRALV